jgi:hypothetical protein
MAFIVPKPKILDYLLKNPGKSQFFKSFGYAEDNWTRLHDDILQLATKFPKRLREETKFGKEYDITGSVVTPNGRMISIHTGWIVLHGDPNNFRFVTAYLSDAHHPQILWVECHRKSRCLRQETLA